MLYRYCSLWIKPDISIIKRSLARSRLLTRLEWCGPMNLMEFSSARTTQVKKIVFRDNILGIASKGSMCSDDYSGGICAEPSSVSGTLANVIAHEMGHNFGMHHDEAVPGCSCPVRKCIMAASASDSQTWSTCSLQSLAYTLRTNDVKCLNNVPSKLFQSPNCGNGFLEKGEECDCGLKENCKNPCCNAETCTLKTNAECATGDCCDLTTCKIVSAGQECRSTNHECDLPEFCTGKDEFCPDDFYKMNGEECREGQAYCYDGKCRTHTDQCHFLWGENSDISDDVCYQSNNKMGVNFGHCGMDQHTQKFRPCAVENVYCGALQCISEYNALLQWRTYRINVTNGDGVKVTCSTIIADDMTSSGDNPSLVPNGVKCGEEKMCVNQECISVIDFVEKNRGECVNSCSGHGHCNNRGHCHCDFGFAPPDCSNLGFGGSIDSGPASNADDAQRISFILYMVFLVVVPILILLGCLAIYVRENSRLKFSKPTTVIVSTSLPTPSKIATKEEDRQHYEKSNEKPTLKIESKSTKQSNGISKSPIPSKRPAIAPPELPTKTAHNFPKGGTNLEGQKTKDELPYYATDSQQFSESQTKPLMNRNESRKCDNQSGKPVSSFKRFSRPKSFKRTAEFLAVKLKPVSKSQQNGYI